MSLSPGVRQTIGAFASQLGLPGSPPGSDGSHAFDFSRSGRLVFEAAERPDRIVLSLSRRLSLVTETVEARILSLAGPGPSGERYLHAGLTPRGVVFAVSLEEREFDLPIIESCLGRLIAAQAQLD